jgi:hypothetical protein
LKALKRFRRDVEGGRLSGAVVPGPECSASSSNIAFLLRLVVFRKEHTCFISSFVIEGVEASKAAEIGEAL